MKEIHEALISMLTPMQINNQYAANEKTTFQMKLLNTENHLASAKDVKVNIVKILDGSGPAITFRGTIFEENGGNLKERQDIICHVYCTR